MIQYPLQSINFCGIQITIPGIELMLLIHDTRVRYGSFGTDCHAVMVFEHANKGWVFGNLLIFILLIHHGEPIAPDC